MAVPVNPRRGGGQRLIVDRAVQNQVQGTVIYLPNAMARAVGTALSNSVTPITRAVYQGIESGAIPRGPMLRANKEIARRAQNAILSGWHARLPLKSGPYRRGSNPQKDRLSGALGEALSESDMTAHTTARGISFINFDRLANQAQHWYRVNYGAYGHNVGGRLRTPKAWPVTIGGQTLFALQDEHEPATHSWLPKRFMFEDNELIPMGPAKHARGKLQGKATRIGGGHRAALFTDLGYRSVAENVDPVYREMLFTYFRKGGMKERYQAKGATVHVTTKGTTTSGGMQ